jgi:hypothetical protein
LRIDGGPQSQRIAVVASRVALAGNHLDEALQNADVAIELARLGSRKPEASADVGEAYLLKVKVLLAIGNDAATHEAARAAARQAVEALTNGLGPRHALTLEAAALTR